MNSNRYVISALGHITASWDDVFICKMSIKMYKVLMVHKILNKMTNGDRKTTLKGDNDNILSLDKIF